ncbi:MAG: helix-turn-helix domain-containing protein [Spirochaetota bacterium]|nr:helix-turn-helix domain-containing protein [Spirochaetota bacterium]
MFGEFVKQKRLNKKFSLRQFCRLLNEDPSNWSKVERGIISPPQEESKLSQIASILDIKIDSDEWNSLVDYANIDAGKIPEYLMSDKEALQSLPAFFRTVGSIKPKPEEIEKLIGLIRGRG